MRKARLLQSVAFLAGCMAVPLTATQSIAQTADSGTQRYDSYDYSSPGYPSDVQDRMQDLPQYRESWDQNGSREYDRFANQGWPQQGYQQQYMQSPMGRNYSQGGTSGQQVFGPYRQSGEQAYGDQGYGQQPQRFGQAGGTGYSGDMSQQLGGESRFGYQAQGEEPSYTQSQEEQWRLRNAQRSGMPVPQEAYGGYGAGGYGSYGQNGPYQNRSYSENFGGPYGQQPGWMRGQQENRFGYQGGYQEYGNQAYDRGRMMQGPYGRHGPMMYGQGGYGMGYGQQAYGGPQQRFNYGGQQQGYNPQQGYGGYNPQQAYGGYNPQQGYGGYNPQQAYGGYSSQQGYEGQQQGYNSQQAYGGAQQGANSQQTNVGALGRVEIVSAGDLVGRSITDSSGNEIGTSRYLVIGARSGKVHFVMIGDVKDLDLGTELLPVPWEMVKVASDQTLTINVPADRLKELPRVAPSDLASVVGPQILGQVHEWIGVPKGSTSATGEAQASSQTGGTGQTQASGQSGTSTQSQAANQGSTSSTGTQSQQQASGTSTQQSSGGQQGTSGSRQQVASAEGAGSQGGESEDIVVLGGRFGNVMGPPALITEGELAGTSVFTADGMPIGDVDQIAIDQDRGQVAYVLVATGGFLGTQEHWLPVPFSVMKWVPTANGYALQIQSDQLATLPELAQATLPRYIRGRDLTMLYYAYGAEPYWGKSIGEQPSGSSDNRG